MYHVDQVFGVIVNMIRDRSSLSSSRKSVVGTAVGNVRASNTAGFAASKGSLGCVCLRDST